MNIASIERNIRRWRVLPIWCLAALHAAPLFAAPTNIDQLMQSLAKTNSARATFIEKKYLSVLDRPVESSGELLYTAPSRLVKKTVKPKPEMLTVDGDAVLIERAGRKHTLQLQDYPELQSLIDSIRGTLAGDRAALERSYRLKLEGDTEKWLLSLKPTDAKIAANIHLIRIEGSGEAVRSTEIIQTDGDRSVMEITPVEAR